MNKLYKYRPEINAKNTDELLKLRNELGFPNIPLNSLSNFLISVGVTCLKNAVNNFSKDIISNETLKNFMKEFFPE